MGADHSSPDPRPEAENVQGYGGSGFEGDSGFTVWEDHLWYWGTNWNDMDECTGRSECNSETLKHLQVLNMDNCVDLCVYDPECELVQYWWNNQTYRHYCIYQGIKHWDDDVKPTFKDDIEGAYLSRNYKAIRMVKRVTTTTTTTTKRTPNICSNILEEYDTLREAMNECDKRGCQLRPYFVGRGPISSDQSYSNLLPFGCIDPEATRADLQDGQDVIYSATYFSAWDKPEHVRTSFWASYRKMNQVFCLASGQYAPDREDFPGYKPLFDVHGQSCEECRTCETIQFPTEEQLAGSTLGLTRDDLRAMCENKTSGCRHCTGGEDGCVSKPEDTEPILCVE